MIVLLSGSMDRTAQLWDATTGRAIGPPLQQKGTVFALSHHGKIVLQSGSMGGTAQLWDATTGKAIGPPLQHQKEVTAAAFGPDGKTVLTGSADKTARLWRIPAPLQGDPERILLWAQVLTGMEVDGGAVRVLDARTWEERRSRLEKLGGPPVP